MRLPSDINGKSVPLTQPTVALSRSYLTPTSATSISLNPLTSLVEVSAIGGGIYLRYQSDVTASNFDEFISNGATRHYVIPDGVTTLSVIEKDTDVEVIIIEK